MKTFLLTITVLGMFNFANAQKTLYNSNGKVPEPYYSEDIDIVFSPSNPLIQFPHKKGNESAGFIPLIGTALDILFKITTNAIENNVKKYTAEYSKQQSFLEAGSTSVPNINFIRTVKLSKSGSEEIALNIGIKAHRIENVDAFIYYIDSLTLKYSSAKTKSKHNTLDFAIEIKPILLVNGEKKTVELEPIVISSIEFASNTYSSQKYRTGFIAIPKGAIFAGVGVKVIETNPAQVRAEKIASFWNDNQKEVRTIVNNFLPKEEEEEKKEEQDDSDDVGNDE